MGIISRDSFIWSRIQTDLNAGEGVPIKTAGFLLLACQGAFQQCLRIFVYCSLLNVGKK